MDGDDLRIKKGDGNFLYSRPATVVARLTLPPFSASRDYRGLEEALAILSRCHEAGQGREVGATLWILEQQRKARSVTPEIKLPRSLLNTYICTTALAFVTGLALIASHRFRTAAESFSAVNIVGSVTLIAGVSRGRHVGRRYRAECEALDRRAAAILSDYDSPTYPQRRLKANQLRELDRLAQAYPELANMAARIREREAKDELL